MKVQMFYERIWGFDNIIVRMYLFGWRSFDVVLQGDIGLNVAQMIVELIRDNRKIVDRITPDQIEMFVSLLREHKVSVLPQGAFSDVMEIEVLARMDKFYNLCYCFLLYLIKIYLKQKYLKIYPVENS